MFRDPCPVAGIVAGIGLVDGRWWMLAAATIIVALILIIIVQRWRKPRSPDIEKERPARRRR